MFKHAWHLVIHSTMWAAPYWFCAKCGVRVYDPPESAGCEIEH